MAELDEMENNWGCNLVRTSGSIHRTFHQFDSEVRTAVPGFQLFSLAISGTDANQVAIEHATDFELGRCLFALGCYSGGKGQLLRFSSSKYSVASQLAIPSDPDEVPDQTRNQTVALPYYIPCSTMPESQFNNLETDCLDALHQKLLRARLAGKAYKAILLEIISCGNGGELSNRFLKKLGLLLSRYNVEIIVDEVMTGGRVGPFMTVTSSAPKEFRCQVKYITMGKITNCGLILMRCPKKPQDSGPTRGTSTALEGGEACQAWMEVMDRLKKKLPETRRAKIIALMDAKKEEERWGRGCLIFTTKVRPWVTKGLKNRLLPMLEDQKLRRNACKPSQWTRLTVNKVLMNSAHCWIEAMQNSDELKDPFVSCLVKYIWQTDVHDITASDLIQYVGEEKANKLATKERECRQSKALARNGKCEKTPTSFFVETLGKAIDNAPEVMKRSRVGSKRKLVYRLNRAEL